MDCYFVKKCVFCGNKFYWKTISEEQLASMDSEGLTYTEYQESNDNYVEGLAVLVSVCQECAHLKQREK